VVLGAAVFCFLPTSIASARFLSPAERDALQAAIAQDHVTGVKPDKSPAASTRGALKLLGAALRNRYLWVVWFAGIFMSAAVATFVTFTPIVLENLLAGTAFSAHVTVQARKGSRDLRPVGLAAVPFALSTLLSYLVALSSERFNELFWHIIACLSFGGVAMTLFMPLAQANVAAGFAAMTLSLAVAFASSGPGMVLVARLCQGEEQVVAQPLSNGFNILGGVVGPFVTAALLHTSTGFKWVAILLGIAMLLAALLTAGLRFWVMHDGGFPDGGTGRRPEQEKSPAPVP
jgi:ACS family tartrate transporter-like MFS transporter